MSRKRLRAGRAMLASLLRMCGLDTSDTGLLPGAGGGHEDSRLVAAARREQRIILIATAVCWSARR